MDSRRAHHFSFLHIGCGSNLLFVKDYEGMVLHSCIGGMEVTAEDDGQVHVRVGAGVVWDDLRLTVWSRAGTVRRTCR